MAPLDTLIGAPAHPPSAWFTEKPDWLGHGTDITVITEGDDIGRAGGYIAAWGSCLRGPAAPQECWTPPPSPTNGEYFNRRSIVVLDPEGSRTTISAGVVGMGHVHAASGRISEAANLHDDPMRQMLIGRYGEDDYGPYFIGAAVPELTCLHAGVINRSAFSGEWYSVNTRLDGSPISASGSGFVYDFLAPAIVSHPALPMCERDYGSTSLAIAASVGDAQPPVFSLPQSTSPSMEPVMTTSIIAPPAPALDINVTVTTPSGEPVAAAAEDFVAIEPLPVAQVDEIPEMGNDLAAANARIDGLEAAVDEMAIIVAEMQVAMADGEQVPLNEDEIVIVETEDTFVS